MSRTYPAKEQNKKDISSQHVNIQTKTDASRNRKQGLRTTNPAKEQNKQDTSSQHVKIPTKTDASRKRIQGVSRCTVPKNLNSVHVTDKNSNVSSSARHGKTPTGFTTVAFKDTFRTHTKTRNKNSIACIYFNRFSLSTALSTSTMAKPQVKKTTAGTGKNGGKRSALEAQLEIKDVDKKNKHNQHDSNDDISEASSDKVVKETPQKETGNIISASPFSPNGEALTMDSTTEDSDSDSDEEESDKAHIICVLPENNHNGGISGFVLYLDGKSDKVLGDIMFMSKPTKMVKKFKAVTGIVSRVVHPLEEDSEDTIKNVAGYKYRGIVVIMSPNRGPPSEEECRQWYTGTFLPAFKKISEGELSDSQYPTLSPTMGVRDHWLSVVIRKDIEQIYKHFVMLTNKAKMEAVNFPKFCQRNHGNLYSIYCKGTLNKHVFSTLGLKRSQVAPEDHEAFDKYMAKKEAKKQKKES